MKILHLATYDNFGGASIAAYRQHTALLRLGVDSQMWVRFKMTDDAAVKTFTPPFSLGIRARRILRRNWLRWQRRRSGIREDMFDDRSEHGGDELASLPQADVLNVQFAWNFIDYPKLFQSIPDGLPVVVTMHEMASFTGGCSYASGCTRFHEACGHCPKIELSRERDFSRKGWERRKAAFAGRPKGKLHIVADSHWLAAEARKSSLLAGLPISVIHYGLDTEVYRPLDRAFARSVLGIPQDAPVVAFAAASVDDKRKGMNHLVEALMGMTVKPFLLTWGQNFPPRLEEIPHLHLGNLDSEHLMALAYNAANVFAMPSLEEAFGQTALEAIACGTPVAAFGAGGIVDTVRHEQTGLLAAVWDSADLRACISRLIDDRQLWSSCSWEGVRVAAAEFSLELNARRYIELYESLLGGSQPAA
jgi:glycosyltransferase involved in cell wall biosynthesis